MALNAQKIFGFVMRVVEELTKNRNGSSGNRTTTTHGGTKAQGSVKTPSRARPQQKSQSAQGNRAVQDYPGDFRGKIHYEYNPSMDGNADPGEVVWAWVPYEEDFSQGKDRPVLIVGRDKGWLLGLMLTSKDKNNSSHRNPNYLDIGTGDWDRERRDSEVKLDRIIRIDDKAVRREGAILDRQRFSNVVNTLNERF